jgi:hypothetical protein
MPRAPNGPRDRLIANAITMVQERGAHATGLSDLLSRSSAGGIRSTSISQTAKSS